MKYISIDIETHDPNLKTFGSGACRDSDTPDDDGSCILVVGTYDGSEYKDYYPFTKEWDRLAKILADESVEKIFHNGIYDLGWLVCGYDLDVNGLCHDTMTRMTYIDEYADLDLDSCCKYFKMRGKNKSDTIEAWYSNHIEQAKVYGEYYGIKIKKTDSLWKHALLLWHKFPDFRKQMIVYNEQDCKITFDLFHEQSKYFNDELYNAYLLDIKLVPLIISMKKNGILVDKVALDKLKLSILQDLTVLENELVNTYGITAEIIASSKKLGERLNIMGIHSSVTTPAGKESWGAVAMDRLMHYPVIQKIQEYKGYSKLYTTYITGSMVNSILSDGRIHCDFSPNKREVGGTVTGRFSSSHPNLQQIPAREKQIGKSYGQAMRALFLPEQGCMISAIDYSQIEYLLLAHFAVGNQAEWFREQANSGVDFHTVAMQATGIPSRTIVKTFNYGVIYGMGWRTALEKNYVLFSKMAAEANKSPEEFVQQVSNDYHSRLPVIKDTMNYVQEVAKFQGYVKTMAGRRQHKPRPQFDPLTGKMNDFMYKMLNKLIQGTAADIMKKAMLDAYEAGIFKVLTLHLTVHDELVNSVPYNKIGTEANQSLIEIMNNTYKEKLLVPMKASCEVGPNWGYWSSDIWQDMLNNKFDKANMCWWGVV